MGIMQDHTTHQQHKMWPTLTKLVNYFLFVGHNQYLLSPIFSTFAVTNPHATKTSFSEYRKASIFYDLFNTKADLNLLLKHGTETQK
jgi:hypothetical protein